MRIEKRSPVEGSRAQDILDAIGNTPLVQVDGVWAKLEFLNPSGSVKARLAKYVIERAEAEGLLHPGDVIVEASSGNTGNALSMVAAEPSLAIRYPFTGTSCQILRRRGTRPFGIPATAGRRAPPVVPAGAAHTATAATARPATSCGFRGTA